jgi:hypothetical protein
MVGRPVSVTWFVRVVRAPDVRDFGTTSPALLAAMLGKAASLVENAPPAAPTVRSGARSPYVRAIMNPLGESASASDPLEQRATGAAQPPKRTSFDAPGIAGGAITASLSSVSPTLQRGRPVSHRVGTEFRCMRDREQMILSHISTVGLAVIASVTLWARRTTRSASCSGCGGSRFSR